MVKSTKKLIGDQRPVSGSKEADNSNQLKELGWGVSEDRYRMDSNKLPWHKERLKDWANMNKIAPMHIDMGIATGCNLGCHFCYGVVQARNGFLGKQGKMNFMPQETIVNTFDCAKKIGVKSIALIGEGENTLNPALYPSIEYARDINFDVSLASHGANIKYNHIESLLTSLKWLRINISAATSKSYEYVHMKPYFDKVMESTDMLVNGKNKLNLKNPNGDKTTIGFQMVITDRNMDQIIPLAKLGKEKGIDYTVFKACSDTPDGRLGAPDKEYLELVDVFKEAESYSDEKYQVIVRWQKLGNMGNKDYCKCHGTKMIIAISGDGTVFPCGHWFSIERDRFAMGNVNENTLENIIKSDRYWEVQNEIQKVDLRQCETNCRQHGVNRTLDQISAQSNPVDYINLMHIPSEKPNHINFI